MYRWMHALIGRAGRNLLVASALNDSRIECRLQAIHASNELSSWYPCRLHPTAPVHVALVTYGEIRGEYHWLVADHSAELLILQAVLFAAHHRRPWS